VQVDGDLESFSTLKDRPKKRIVQVATPAVAVDYCSLETVVSDCAFQLTGGDNWGCGWQCGKPGKAVWMAPNGLPQTVVGLAGERLRGDRIELLHTGRVQRQHLQVDACGVHVCDPEVVEIQQLIDEVGSN